MVSMHIVCKLLILFSVLLILPTPYLQSIGLNSSIQSDQSATSLDPTNGRFVYFVDDSMKFDSLKYLIDNGKIRVLDRYPNLNALVLDRGYGNSIDIKNYNQVVKNDMVNLFDLDELYQEYLVNQTLNHGQATEVLYNGVFKSQNFDVNTDKSKIRDEIILNPDNLVESEQVSKLSANIGYNGSGIKIGIIDSGVDINHPYLTHVSFEQADFSDSYPNGDHLHGTAVASCIVGKTGNSSLGAAVGATIFSAMLGNAGTGFIGGDFLGAFDYLISKNVDIINTSFSGDPLIWDPVISILYNNNITLVGSVGNGGNGDNIARFATGPGSHPLAFGVGSINSSDYISDFSSIGPNLDNISKPDVVHMGESVFLASKSSYGLAIGSGTSFSSPLIVSGIAVLMHAMNDNSISYDPSIIKSMLLKHSSNLNGSKNRDYYGFGQVNITKTWLDILINGSRSIIIPDTIGSGVLSEFHARGGVNQLSQWIYTSFNPNELSVDISGNISTIMSNHSFVEKSGRSPMFLNSSTLISYGLYVGVISIKHVFSNYEMNFTMSTLIDKEYKGSILMDTSYTEFDLYGFNRINGEFTREAFLYLKRNGYTVEHNFKGLTHELLLDIDVLWMPDMLSREYLANNHNWNSAIMNVIHSYVMNGGSLLINGFGLLSESYWMSTQVNVMNQFLRPYQIEMNTIEQTDIMQLNPWSVDIFNSTEMGNARNHDHWGNYLNILDDKRTTVISGSYLYDFLNVVATHDIPSSGRVLVSSTNAFMDNCVFMGCERSGNNIQFFDSVMSWLTNENRVILENYTYNPLDQYISINYYSTSASVVKVTNPTNNTELTVESVSIDNWYTHTFPTNSEGIYIVEISHSDTYVRKEIIVDNTPPILLYGDFNESTVLPNDIIQFGIEENNMEGFAIYLDGIEITEWGSINSNQLEIVLSSVSIGIHELLISLTDRFHNEVQYRFIFYVEANNSDSSSDSNRSITGSGVISSEYDEYYYSDSGYRLNYPIIMMIIVILIRRRTPSE
ncbi:MAG: S8 family serine peptidase [Candidatus Heimdallarchaeota archaeon]|nr:S8 family serine peptidase [Candidatus Heimdallarchaeota archaeon]